ncbi:GGDEF domain-containing protein [Aquifex sp.]
MELGCKIYEKLKGGEALTEEDKKILKTIIKKEFQFLAEQNILPTPENYARWFFVFCYVVENNLEASVNELIELYYKIFKDAKVDLRLTVNIEHIAKEVGNIVKDYINTVQKYDRDIGEKSEELKKYSEKTDSEVLKEILERIKDLQETNQKLVSELRTKERELERLQKEISTLKEQAHIDFLTGLKNRRSIEKALSDFLKDLHSYGYPFVVIMMDLNKFKQINDTHGHVVGDCILKQVGELLRKYLRAKDVVGRYGGDEFIIILPGVKLDVGIKVAQRLASVIRNHTFRCDSLELNISASFGILEVTQDFKDIKEVLEAVDKKLYEAKEKEPDHIAY